MAYQKTTKKTTSNGTTIQKSLKGLKRNIDTLRQQAGDKVKKLLIIKNKPR